MTKTATEVTPQTLTPNQIEACPHCNGSGQTMGVHPERGTVSRRLCDCRIVQGEPVGLPRNVARFGPEGQARWFVEVEPANPPNLYSPGRIAISPEVGRTMVRAARRVGELGRVHRWGSVTTWHFRRGAS